MEKPQIILYKMLRTPQSKFMTDDHVILACPSCAFSEFGARPTFSNISIPLKFSCGHMQHILQQLDLHYIAKVLIVTA